MMHLYMKLLFGGMELSLHIVTNRETTWAYVWACKGEEAFCFTPKGEQNGVIKLYHGAALW